MIWYYERHGNYLRCETREVREIAGGYELVVIQPDGTERVYSFATSDALLRKQEELELALRGDGWAGPFGRLI